MNLQTATIEQVCPQAEIAAYVDGELAPAEELAIELHVANCKNCLAELNLQKQMLSALDFGFDDHAEIELPKNFAKVVAVRAESGVCGLRSKEERFRALFLCAALFLVAVIGLGSETGNLLAGFGKFFEKSAAVLNFVWHLVFDLSVGIIIILRSLSGHFVFGSALSLIVIGGLFALAAAILSRLVFQPNRS
jgi:hypothetical protein